jgi:transposase
MIDYTIWCEIRRLSETGLKAPQIARVLSINPKTAQKWVDQPYAQRKASERSSKLDPYKPLIRRMLDQEAYTGEQILREIRKQGYPGGRSILQEYLSVIRPPRKKAFATLSFVPGECAQVDWGHAGSVQVGNTRRRLSFFVMTLGYSRMIYIEFTLSEKMEHFLGCHKNAFEFFGGIPEKVMIDNLKSAVLEHPRGGPVRFHPRYLDFAAHYGFEPRACNVRAPHEKGQVERAVSYVRSSFLNGLHPESFAPINPQARLWMDTVANLRVHKELNERPIDRFDHLEKAALKPLGLRPYDVGVSSQTSANSQFRVVLDTNKYSVPAEYASRRLTLRQYPDQVLIYHEHNLIATHPRSYQRRQDILIEDHQRALLAYKKNAREQQALSRLLRLSPQAELFIQGLQARNLRARHHILKVCALVDIYGEEALRRALEDAVELEAFHSEYILNLLEQRSRPLPEAGPLHLTRNEDMLNLELPEPDLSIYDPENEKDENEND